MKPTPFRKAARNIDAGLEEFACCALDRAHAVEKQMCPERWFFFRAFRPRTEREATVEPHWFGNPGWYGPAHSPESRQARVLGLLLAAELVRDGFTAEDFK